MTQEISQEKFAIKQIKLLIFLLDSKIQMVCCMGGRGPGEGQKEPEFDFILVLFIYLGYNRLI